MDKISILGIGIAENVFQVQGINEAGEIVVRRQYRVGFIYCLWDTHFNYVTVHSFPENE